MNNGDDIHNLLKTLGHDAGLYQDLAKYNASRAALRRAAMGRPADAPSPAPAPAPAPAPTAFTPQSVSRDEPAALSAILHRLCSPNEPRTAQGLPQTRPTPGSNTPDPAPPPARLDRLFGRLVTRTFGTPDR